MACAVEFSPGAEREFRKLARETQLRLRPRIDALADDPRPAGAKKLKGRDELRGKTTGAERAQSSPCPQSRRHPKTPAIDP